MVLCMLLRSPAASPKPILRQQIAKMISDDDLYQLAIFLGSCAMLLIVLYHFLEVNSKDTLPASSPSSAPSKAPSTSSKQSAVGSSGAGGSSAAGKKG